MFSTLKKNKSQIQVFCFKIIMPAVQLRINGEVLLDLELKDLENAFEDCFEAGKSDSSHQYQYTND
jgi:hypothetical protein